MGEPTPGRLLELTRASLAEVRLRLANRLPGEWNECPAQMDAAARHLRQALELAVRPDRPREPGARAAFLAVQKDLAATAALLDSSAALYGGWMRLMESMAAGYSADGTPAQSWTGARISAEG